MIKYIIAGLFIVAWTIFLLLYHPSIPSVTIWNTYSTDNISYQSLEPVTVIPLQDNSFTWDNYKFEINK